MQIQTTSRKAETRYKNIASLHVSVRLFKSTQLHPALPGTSEVRRVNRHWVFAKACPDAVHSQRNDQGAESLTTGRETARTAARRDRSRIGGSLPPAADHCCQKRSKRSRGLVKGSLPSMTPCPSCRLFLVLQEPLSLIADSMSTVSDPVA